MCQHRTSTCPYCAKSNRVRIIPCHRNENILSCTSASRTSTELTLCRRCVTTYLDRFSCTIAFKSSSTLDRPDEVSRWIGRLCKVSTYDVDLSTVRSTLQREIENTKHYTSAPGKTTTTRPVASTSTLS